MHGLPEESRGERLLIGFWAEFTKLYFSSWFLTMNIYEISQDNLKIVKYIKL